MCASSARVPHSCASDGHFREALDAGQQGRRGPTDSRHFAPGDQAGACRGARGRSRARRPREAPESYSLRSRASAGAATALPATRTRTVPGAARPSNPPSSGTRRPPRASASSASPSGSRSRCSSTASAEQGARRASRCSPRRARSSSGSRRGRGSSGSRPVRPRALRCRRDLPELRHGEPRGAEVLRRVRHRARARLPACGAANEPGEKFCGECGAPLASATRAGSRSPAGRTCRRAPARLGPVRRPRRLHDALGEPRLRGRARAPLPLLRHAPAPDRAATAARSRSSSATR